MAGLATAVNGSVPGPTLRLREGDDVTIAVTNHLPVESSIHWHGLRLPAPMDGVPGLSFPGIAPDQTFVYRFLLRQHRTYWYHSHSGFQEQTGQYGALIIDPQGSDPISYDRDYVILLSDWTDEDPETVLSNLKQSSDYYNYHQPSAENFKRRRSPPRPRSHRLQSHALGPHEHESRRHPRCQRRDLYLSHQWPSARR